VENTNIKAEFIIIGADFPPADISKRLNIQPTSQWRKGDVLKNGRTREYSGWEISTEYQESLDMGVQLNKVISLIKEKNTELKEICEKYETECKFCIVVKIENGETPAMVLSREVIEFANSINAEIEFDVYANPYSNTN
jgi:hypothetical protein